MSREGHQSGCVRGRLDPARMFLGSERRAPKGGGVATHGLPRKEGQEEEEAEEGAQPQLWKEQQKSRQPFRQGHVGLVCDKPSSEGARSYFRVPADS